MTAAGMDEEKELENKIFGLAAPIKEKRKTIEQVTTSDAWQDSEDENDYIDSSLVLRKKSKVARLLTGKEYREIIVSTLEEKKPSVVDWVDTLRNSRTESGFINSSIKIIEKGTCLPPHKINCTYKNDICDLKRKIQNIGFITNGRLFASDNRKKVHIYGGVSEELVELVSSYEVTKGLPVSCVALNTPSGSNPCLLVGCGHSRLLKIDPDQNSSEWCGMMKNRSSFTLLAVADLPSFLFCSVADNNKVVLSDVRMKNCINEFKVNSVCKGLYFNDSSLYTGDDKGNVIQWDMKNYRCNEKFVDPGSFGISAMAGYGKYLAVGSTSGYVNLYDINKGKPAVPLKAFPNLTTPVQDIAFHPSAEIMATSSTNLMHALRLAHLPTLTTFQNFPKKKFRLGHVTCVAFDASGASMVVGNTFGVVQLFELPHY